MARLSLPCFQYKTITRAPKAVYSDCKELVIKLYEYIYRLHQCHTHPERLRCDDAPPGRPSWSPCAPPPELDPPLPSGCRGASGLRVRSRRVGGGGSGVPPSPPSPPPSSFSRTGKGTAPVAMAVSPVSPATADACRHGAGVVVRRHGSRGDRRRGRSTRDAASPPLLGSRPPLRRCPSRPAEEGRAAVGVGMGVASPPRLPAAPPSRSAARGAAFLVRGATTTTAAAVPPRR